MNHWVSGWIDWNIVLDKQGGPNHVGNFCGAPIMIDTDTGYVYYTPIYYILSQLSRTIRPGDKAVQVDVTEDKPDSDKIYSSASVNSDNLLSIQILNTSKKQMDYQVQIGNQFASIAIDANALLTIRIQL